MNELITVLNDLLFGIEIESCVHSLGTLIDSEDQMIDNLISCFNYKSLDLNEPHLIFDWDNPTDDRTYDKWSIISEYLTCYPEHVIPSKSLDYFMRESRYIEKSDDLTFQPIEIVTPILDMKMNEYECGKGWYNFILIWLGWVMDKNLVYNVNRSQGLHINLSYTKLIDFDYISKFVKLWYLYEPIILRLINPDRLKGTDKYAVPLRRSSIQQLSTTIRNKYTAVHVHSNRIEIRIYQGTVDFREIYNWTLFCMILLAQSIIQPEHDIQDYKNILKDIKKYVEDFFNLIPDDDLRSYLSSIYNVNRGIFPRYTFVSKKEKIIKRPWEILTNNDKDLINTKRSVDCFYHANTVENKRFLPNIIFTEYTTYQDKLLKDMIYDSLDFLTNLPIKQIFLNSFKGDITPLSNSPIERLHLNSFNGDLTPLTNLPLKILNLDKFTGELVPFKDGIIDLYLNSFNGDLTPIINQSYIELIYLKSYTGSLEPLRNSPIEEIFLNKFNGDLSPLSDMPIRSLFLSNYMGSLEPLRDMPIKTLSLEKFNGSLEPLRDKIMKNVHLNSFTGDLSPLNNSLLHYLIVNERSNIKEMRNISKNISIVE